MKILNPEAIGNPNLSPVVQLSADEAAELDAMQGIDPGRALIMSVVEDGLLTPAEGEKLNQWANELATEITAGRITEEQLHARIRGRVASDIARRGKA